jgi:ligand-binding sensor domain-containing protein
MGLPESRVAEFRSAGSGKSPPLRVVFPQNGSLKESGACGGGGFFVMLAPMSGMPPTVWLQSAGLRMLALCWLVIAVWVYPAAAKPSFLIHAWQTSEGLPHNSPTGVCQGLDGYLWIATNSGLARFDGIRFEKFTTADGLPANQVQSLFVDSRGRVWVGTQQGVAVRQGGLWVTPPGVPRVGPVWSIGETRDESMWFGTEQGVWRLKDGKAGHVLDGLPNPHVRHLQPASDGSLWIVCRNGICRWVDERLVAAPPLPSWAAGRELWGISPGPGGQWVLFGENVLLGGNGGEWDDLTKGMPAAGGIHIACVAGADDSLWVATRNQGLACRTNGLWTRIDAGSGLSHDDVRALMQDSEGNLWVCTNGGGINRVRHRRFEVFGVAEGLGRHVTTALVSDAAGNVWAGTDGGGVKRWVDGSFVSALPDNALPDSYIWSLCAGRDGSLWIGTFRHGVIRWKDGESTGISREEGLLDGWVPSLMESRSGQLWVGTHNGGVQRIEGMVPRSFRGSADGGAAPITGLLEDRAGVLWVATNGDGLMRRIDGRWETIGSARGLPSASVAALHEDETGRLWVGTAGGGLCLWRGDSFTVWDTRHGLACDAVLQVLDDSRGNLWLGTDVGLQRVGIDDLLEVAGGRRGRLGRADLYSRSEGLPSPQFSSGHGNLTTKTPDGSLWFSIAGGAVRIAPGDFAGPHEPLPLGIESVLAGGRLLWHHERPAVEGKLVMHWPVAPLEIRFAAPSFSAPEKLRFRHRLVGLEDQWRDAQGSRFATFSSLPPGRFRFEDWNGNASSTPSARASPATCTTISAPPSPKSASSARQAPPPPIPRHPRATRRHCRSGAPDGQVPG